MVRTRYHTRGYTRTRTTVGAELEEHGTGSGQRDREDLALVEPFVEEEAPDQYRPHDAGLAQAGDQCDRREALRPDNDSVRHDRQHATGESTPGLRTRASPEARAATPATHTHDDRALQGEHPPDVGAGVVREPNSHAVDQRVGRDRQPGQQREAQTFAGARQPAGERERADAGDHGGEPTSESAVSRSGRNSSATIVTITGEVPRATG